MVLENLFTYQCRTAHVCTFAIANVALLHTLEE
jgi:hypothetical protein